MSKSEKFIIEHTRNCSNELGAVESRAGKEVISYYEWLTPDQARRAVEIAKEEIYEWLKENADTYTWYNEFIGESGMTDDFIDDLKKAMKDE